MQIVLEKTKYHRFALYYNYSPEVVKFCRLIKDSFGFREFSFDASGDKKRWVFSSGKIVEAIAGMYPQVVVAPEVAELLHKENIEIVAENMRMVAKSIVREKKETTFRVDGIKGAPYMYQNVGVEFIENAGGRAIIADEPGCISGDAKIIYNRGGNARTISLRELAFKMNGGRSRERAWDRNIPTRTRALTNDGMFVLNDIWRVLYKGVAEVGRLVAVTDDGVRYSLDMTYDHLVGTPHGWVAYKDLKIGDRVIVNGDALEYCSTCKKRTPHSTYQYAKYRGSCKLCTYKHLRNNHGKQRKIALPNGESFGNGGYILVSGCWAHPTRYNHSRVKGVPKHILVYEAFKNDVSYDEWVGMCKTNTIPSGAFYVDTKNFVVHHKNGDKTDNTIGNLELLTPGGHAEAHSDENTKNLWNIVPSTAAIAELYFVGKTDVYDIQMAGDHKNFIASGVVVHNCGKSLQALGFAIHKKFNRSLVVCPASVKFAWENEVKKWSDLTSVVINSKTDLDSIDPGTNVWIINYDILMKMADKLAKMGFEYVVGDECFVAGTKVDTPNGPVPIEKIKEGDTVCNAVGEGIVKSSKLTYYTNRLARVHTSDGGVVTCTTNHQFFTNNGWVRACELNQTHVIIKRDETMRIVQEGGGKDERESFLWVLLRSEMEELSGDYPSKNVHEGEITEDEHWYEKGSCGKSTHSGQCIKTYDKKQPDEKKGRAGESKCDIKKNWPQTTYQRRERPWSDEGRESSSILSTSERIQLPNKNKETSWQRVPNLLQGRRRHSGDLPGDRSGRGLPSVSCETGTGQKEDEDAYGVRVDCVEILKQEDIKKLGGSENGVAVYNLEVAGHPSYSVNGLLVHNCHMIKSPSAKRTKAFKFIASSAPNVVLLTGTPLLSRTSELFSLLNIIDPKTWSSYYTYVRRYCAAKQTRFGLDVSGVSNPDELHARINNYFIRRKKSEVLEELPPKNYIRIPILLSDEYWLDYVHAEEDLAEYLWQNGKRDSEEPLTNAEAIVKLNTLRHISALGKVAAANEMIETIINSGQKALVFSSYIDPLKMVQKKYADISVMITGETPIDDRKTAVTRFQEDPNVKLFLGGYKSAGVGITLTAASNVVFLDYAWNPADHRQAEDRAHRPGATAERLSIYQVHAMNTIDEKMSNVLKKKQEIFDRVIEGEVVDHAEIDMVEELIEDIKARYPNKRHKTTAVK